jgi:hypothetical protein
MIQIRYGEGSNEDVISRINAKNKFKTNFAVSERRIFLKLFFYFISAYSTYIVVVRLQNFVIYKDRGLLPYNRKIYR